MTTETIRLCLVMDSEVPLPMFHCLCPKVNVELAVEAAREALAGPPVEMVFEKSPIRSVALQRRRTDQRGARASRSSRRLSPQTARS
jgi:hypothetical protein